MTDTNRPADWKHFDDFSAGIATNRLPTTDALSGRRIKISLKNGRAIELAFNAVNEVTWREGDQTGIDWYEAINVAADMFFVNMTFSARPNEDEAFVLNLRTRRVLSVRERLRDADEARGEPRVLQDYAPGIIGDPSVAADGMEPAPTRELIGLTAHYEYSPHHVYEHIYLSSERYAWQNLVGVQRGHGDVDLATTFKFDHNQYVFGFREFIIPVASIFFYDYDAMRSTGKFLGVTSQGRIENKPAGAFIEVKSRTVYSDRKAPV
ncbi:MoaF C-terminal domain-containing protein [Bradyrhizobium manausense]|uniref:MoaF C-terminal domain-containing protein n=1 Tax=Bradyrhizobium manausense TaxID=989370 RepID=UPI001BA55791|nr:MoaF C-terminal domain-containing protein [Bradyrhizobium manausense]MBR0725590.1 MoaF N-terminal domain-containing protein [Bradyrhizobium manausense]